MICFDMLIIPEEMTKNNLINPHFLSYKPQEYNNLYIILKKSISCVIMRHFLQKCKSATFNLGANIRPPILKYKNLGPPVLD